MKLKMSAAVLAACVASSTGMQVFAAEPMAPSMAVEGAMSKSANDFFDTAASADMFEIQASQLAETKSSDPAIKSYAEKMVSDHTESSAKLKTLAMAKNVTLPTTLLKRHQKMLDTLNKDASGKKFDDAYKSAMVASHKEAVSLYDKNSKKAEDPDVKSFAMMMLPKLQMHGSMAMDLKKA